MDRSSLIVTALAAGGVFVAGSIASVAVVNAASSSQATSGTVALVSDAQDQATPAIAVPAPVASSAVPTPASTPRASAATKPASPTKQPARPAAKPSTTPAPAHSTKPKPKPDKAGKSVSSSRAAHAAVSSAGGRVIGVAKGTHGGRDSWAVRIQRSDGSILTGYVDRGSGTVFDWILHHAPTSSSGSGSGSHGDSGKDDSGSSSNGQGHDEADDDGSDDGKGDGNSNGHGNSDGSGKGQDSGRDPGGNHDWDDD